MMAAAVCVFAGAAYAQEAATKATAASINQFGEDMFRQMQKTEGPAKNLLISPYSIASALALAGAGSQGATRDEFAAILHSPDILAAGYAGLNTSLIPARPGLLKRLLPGKDSGIELYSANSLWLSDKLTFLPEYLDKTSGIFNASAETVDFGNSGTARRINKWVEDITRGMIPELIDKLDASTAAVLVNALYFKGKWQDPFEPDDTQEKDFHLDDGSTRPAQLMFKDSEFQYREDDNHQAVHLPYRGGKYEMMVILPREGKKVADLSPAIWDMPFSTQLGYLWLPRMKLDYSIELAEPLKALGLSHAFDPASADFWAMVKQSPDLSVYISRVIHKTMMEVEETGTKAAAATAVMMGVTSMAPMEPPPHFTMRVDRPFMVVLRDVPSDTILFLGQVADPGDM